MYMNHLEHTIKNVITAPPNPPNLPQAMTSVGTSLPLHAFMQMNHQERTIKNVIRSPHPDPPTPKPPQKTLQAMNNEDLVQHLYVKSPTLNSSSCCTTSK